MITEPKEQADLEKKRADPETCFQKLILKLQAYWAEKGCVMLQPYDMEVGAATFHWATLLRSLGPEPWCCAYVQPSRRPADGRYGDNPNRLQHYYQYQVIIKPSPPDAKELYLKSLEEIGIKREEHDIRFLEDDWESPTLGASGLGWEICCDGMEITQFTYFQQVASLKCAPVTLELTYGLERLAMYVQEVDNVFSLDWDGVPPEEGGKSYGDIHHQAEREYSHYNFNYTSIAMVKRHFKDSENQSRALLKQAPLDPEDEEAASLVQPPQPLVLPAYDHCLKMSHLFNLLDARGVMDKADREKMIARVRACARACAQAWLNLPAEKRSVAIK